MEPVENTHTLCCNLCQCLNNLSTQSLETIPQSWKTSLLSFDSMKQNSSLRKRNNSSVNHCKSSLNGTCKLIVGLPAMGHPHQLPPWATGIHNTTQCTSGYPYWATLISYPSWATGNSLKRKPFEIHGKSMLNNLYTKIEVCLHIRSKLALHSLIIPGMWGNCLGADLLLQSWCFCTQARGKQG